MFARQLVYYAGQTNGHYLRGYELPTQGPLSVEEYPRSLQHMQEWRQDPICPNQTFPRTFIFLPPARHPSGQKETGRRGNRVSYARQPSTDSWTVNSKLCADKAWNEILIKCNKQYYKFGFWTVQYGILYFLKKWIVYHLYNTLCWMFNPLIFPFENQLSVFFAILKKIKLKALPVYNLISRLFIFVLYIVLCVCVCGL